MTKITNVTVDWMNGSAKSPRFNVELDNVPCTWPDVNDPVWIKDGGIHLALGMDEVLIPYFYSDGKPTKGFGGRTFSGTFTDGEKFSYKGAWSSRAACVNASEHAYNHVVDVVIGHMAASVRLVELVCWFIANRESVDWGLVLVNDGDAGPILQPTRADGTLKGSGKIIHTY